MWQKKPSSFHLDSIIDFCIFYTINLFLIIKELAKQLLYYHRVVIKSQGAGDFPGY